MITSTLQEELRDKIDNKTKPPGALGMLEAIALQIGTIQNTSSPAIKNPHIVVFAADHGIAAAGLVNPYPQAVTAQMVLNFINDGAAINVFCRQHTIKLEVVDSGVNYDFDNSITSKRLIDAKIGYGTKDYKVQQAMTEKEALSAIEKGKAIVEDIFQSGCNTIGFGEMGIGNTSSASLIMSAITGLPVTECVGRGTGVNDEQLATKIKILKEVYLKHEIHLSAGQPLSLLTKIGGFEIAMMTGAYLKAAELDMIIVVDGFISTAALLLALKSDKKIINNCIFAHTSGEQGHEKMLAYLQAKPLLQLGMRLGEGTGAALAIPLIQSAVNFLNEMASFRSAGISEKV
ncbi:MAG: nicotinate-nucleotide--dimethylbenzimidazole phosphoribosyltransferase [Bacteroidota bacterium]|nr:nicotinate-nucleotide--dimethylbenzimidazole phosphoribosyltransferase [Bacteroidota bacterium]